MWVYPESTEVSVEGSALPQLQQIQLESSFETEELSTGFAETAQSGSASAFLPPEKKQSLHNKMRPSGDCWLLAAAFLIGSAAAGIIQAGCDAQEWEILQYYLSSWSASFSVRDAAGAVTLFRAEYLTLGLFASILLLLGFSVLGTQFIFLWMMFYGMGSGLLLVQLCSDTGWKAALAVLLAAGIPVALAEGGLCLFGASALRMSSRLQRSVFQKAQGAPLRAGVLVGKYLLLLAVFAPLCGLCVGLSYLVAGF